MYFLLLPPLAVLAGMGVWLLLGRTKLARPLRLLFAVLAGAAAALLLFWASLCLAIFAWQWRNPPTW